VWLDFFLRADLADVRLDPEPVRVASQFESPGILTNMTRRVEFGCDYCADDQNRWHGHVAQIGANEERGTILLRCPQCGALYENTAGGDDRTRRLTTAEAARLYPGSVEG
jgi:hypothetical protein